MTSVISPRPNVNSMHDVRRTLRRGIATKSAMQLLAEWDRNRHGLPFESFKALPRDDRAAYEQITERMIATFEATLLDREPEQRDVTQAAERDAWLLMERQRARFEASQRGHDLRGWATVDGRFDETASCARCARLAVLLVTYEPLLDIRRDGSALTEGCLVAATTEVR